MDAQQMRKILTQFDAMPLRVPDTNIEYWFARDLQEP
jgi:hypothetical protein